MSGITEDGFPCVDAAAARRLYDPAFKLFGRTIPVSSDCKGGPTRNQELGCSVVVDTSSIQDVGDETPESEDESSAPDELGSSSGSNDGGDEEKLVQVIGNDLEDAARAHAADLTKEGIDADIPSTEDEGKDDQDQAPKKPDKPVPCPRCQSLDTKFCYFNNYNVNQPRHFCKNCQRYWTAGGTLRNVPVGAGRRKNKHSISNPRGMLPDVVMVRSDLPENAQQLLSCPSSLQSGLNRHANSGLQSSVPRHLLPLDLHSLAALESSPSSAVLSFGKESPVCISTGTGPYTPCKSEVLQGYKPEMSQAQAKRNLNMHESPSVGLHMDQKPTDAKHDKEQNATSVANEFGAKLLKSVARQPVGERAIESSQLEAPFTNTPKPEAGAASDIPKYVDAALAWASCTPFPFMGSPWQYGANLGWGNAIPPAALANVAQGANANPAVALANVAQAAASSCNSAGSKPLQLPNFVAQPPPWAAAMGPWPGGMPWALMQNPLWAPPGWGGAWTMPWAAPFTAAAAAATAAANPDLGSTILGKHPWEQSEAGTEKGGSLLVPKTLRIDDPGEAARSSIWSTLGISLRSDTLTSGGIFRDFKSKGEGKESDDPHAQTRNSNPAAMNRSHSFQENILTSPKVDAKDK